MAWIAGLLILTGVGFIVMRLARPQPADTDPKLVAALAALSAAQSELAGRMSQISESSTISQAALTKALNERLDALGKQVGDNLVQSADKTTLSLTDLQKRLTVIDEAQRSLTGLSGQVVSLQDILSNKQARGAFGEIQLGDLVRDMLPQSAYELQATLGNGKRADCLIKLPNPPGSIAIDSKFPLEAYRALREAGDEAARVIAARAFVTDVRKHINDISERYIVPGETAEMAVMFLPSEAVYAELHANFPQVVEHGHKARVFIVSPSTMWATLNTMRAVLKDVRMREQAGVIQKEVLELFADVGRLRDRTGNLRKHFENVEKDVREIETSTDRILRRADRIRDVQLTDGGNVVEELAIGSATAKILPLN